MFAEAIRGAAEFTRAVLISTRAMSGDVQTGLGTFIILNSEGWILTAAHIAEPFLKIQEDKRKLAELNAAKEAVLAQEGLSATKRERKLRALSVDSGWLTHVSCFWGADDIKAGVWHLDGAADLAAVRLVNFKLPEEQRFPKLGDPKIELPQGRSLCKLGYPFHNFKTEFDGASGRFKINEEVTLVRYPLDGILTRYNQV